MYLALTCSNKNKVDNELQGILPRRLGKRGSKPSILTADVDEKLERWWYPVTPGKLTEIQKRQVMASVIQQMVKVTFSTHFYEWEGQIFKQISGGPIGLRATGPVSRILMDYWVSEIRKLEDRSGTLAIINPVKYEKVKFHLLKKYVDDCIVAMDTLRAGTRWSKVEKAMVWSQETQDLDTHQGKVRQVNSMEQVALMASDIVSCLKFTNDCPQINSEGTMAVLDTQMWTGQEARQTGIPRDMLEDKDLIKTKMGPLREIVLYKFYQKPMANRVGNRKASAAPEQQKVSKIFQEFLRRLKNTSRDLPPGRRLRELVL